MPDIEFKIIASKCPWRVAEWCNGFIQKCTETNCAVWHFIISYKNKG